MSDDAIVMVGVQYADGEPIGPAPGPYYLERFDPEFQDGLGRAYWTCDLAKAQLFSNFAEVVAEWKRQSATKPLRADGAPNRPLTAVTITISRLQLERMRG